MRIVGGELGGRRISAPAGQGTRPTSDRVRESLFSILGPPPPETAVLDAFAGSGALALEALSRGADRALLIEEGRAAARVVRANLEALGLTERAELWVANAVRALAARRPAAAPFRWVFLDPPYASDLGAQALEVLGRGDLLAGDAVVVLEHDRRGAAAPEHGCLVKADQRLYGDTAITFYRRHAS
jgi:16S rRNA (guanine966-N2)-methyltransferase